MEGDQRQRQEEKVALFGREMSKVEAERLRRALWRLYQHAIERGREMEEHPERFEQKQLDEQL